MDEKQVKAKLQQIVEGNKLTLIEMIPVAANEFIPMPNVEEMNFLWGEVYDWLRSGLPGETDFDKQIAKAARETGFPEAQLRAVFREKFLQICYARFLKVFVLRYKQMVVDSTATAMWEAVHTAFQFTEEEKKQAKKEIAQFLTDAAEKAIKEHYGLPTKRGGSDKDVPDQLRKAYADRVKVLYPQWVRGKKAFKQLPDDWRNTATFLSRPEYAHLPPDIVDQMGTTRPSDLALLHAAKEFNFAHSLITLDSYFKEFYGGFKNISADLNDEEMAE